MRQKNKVSDKFRQNRILLYLRFHPNDAEETQGPGDGDVHPFFIEIRDQTQVGNNHGGPLQTLESEEGVANNVFFGFVCGVIMICDLSFSTSIESSPIHYSR